MGYSDFSEQNSIIFGAHALTLQTHSDVIVKRSSDVDVVDRVSQQGHIRVPGLLPLLQEEGMDHIKSRTK
jgi:hypothetical protein